MCKTKNTKRRKKLKPDLEMSKETKPETKPNKYIKQELEEEGQDTKQRDDGMALPYFHHIYIKELYNTKSTVILKKKDSSHTLRILDSYDAKIRPP